jgi:ADP-heptose:LPS heptosyltransferase
VPEAHYNLGILLHRMGKEDEARGRFEHAIKLLPKLTEAKVSLAGCFLNQGDLAMGTYWLREATRSISEAPDSVYSRAFAKLTLGDLMGGWQDYDRRWKTASFLVENRRQFGNATHWNGKPIPGKNLYIHTEQGAGDVIMFSRFVEQVAERSQARTIVFEVGDTLTKFMSQVKGVDFVIPSNMPVPEEAVPIHHYLPLMGMMRQCKFFDYDKVPHPEGWLEPLESEVVVSDTPAFKVGIAWAGSKFHKNDRYRSIQWAQFRDAIIAPFKDRGAEVQFYSFQVGERARDIDDANDLGHLITDLTPQLKDFNDTAAAASKMDLMVLVDTATVHVAASLKQGPPILMFVPAAPDWRWLLKGWSTPWYDRVTLFRQDKAEHWLPALEMAQKNVESFVDEISATR